MTRRRVTIYVVNLDNGNFTESTREGESDLGFSPESVGFMATRMAQGHLCGYDCDTCVPLEERNDEEGSDGEPE